MDLDESYKDYPSIIKGKGLNGFPKPEAPKAEASKPAEPVKQTTAEKKTMKITIEYDDHRYSGLLEEI